jgi:hypothetical protein
VASYAQLRLSAAIKTEGFTWVPQNEPPECQNKPSITTKSGTDMHNFQAAATPEGIAAVMLPFHVTIEAIY